MLLLSPHIPLLFMGEEFGETRPFLFFTDFHGDLAEAVREGRRSEFAGFAAFGEETGNPRPERARHVPVIEARLAKGRIRQRGAAGPTSTAGS